MFAKTVLCVILLLCLCELFHGQNLNFCEYEELRERLINEDAQSFSSDMDFSNKESIVDRYLHTLKQTDLDVRATRGNQYQFLAAHNFLRVKDAIQETKLFSILKQMPKAGQLHLHLGASFDHRQTLDFIRARPEISSKLYLLYCEDEPRMYGYFTSEQEASQQGNCTGMLNCEWRSTSANTTDELLRLSILTDDQLPYHSTDYESEQIWAMFTKKFHFGASLTSYQPVYEYALLNSLQHMEQNGVSFVEYRDYPGSLYTLEKVPGWKQWCGNSVFPPVPAVTVIKKAIESFSNTSNFVGGSYIFSPTRAHAADQYEEVMSTFWQLRNDSYLSDFITGFDFVSEEDRGSSLFHLYSVLNNTIDYYFHSGETVQPRDIESPNLVLHTNDEATEYNLVDAVLNNAKRIGHGTALHRHPVLMDRVREQGICVEICPISNQVLAYTPDLRSHPAVLYMANNLKIVLSSDDPGLMNYVNMTYDSYVAYTSWGVGLRDMKQLVSNGIECSSMHKKYKDAARESIDKQWDNFVDMVHDEVCNMDTTQVVALKDQMIHCQRVQGVQVSKTCKSVDVDTSSPIDFSFGGGVAFNFCDNITCVFNTKDGNEATRVTGQVTLPCQLRCMTPEWSEHGTYYIDVLHNGNSLCGTYRNCTTFEFFGKKDETSRWLIGTLIGIVIIAVLVTVIVFLIPRKKKPEEEAQGLLVR